MFNTKLGKHLGKLKLRWNGPFTVCEEIASGTFSLKILDSTIQLDNVNGCRLRPYHEKGNNREIGLEEIPQILSIWCTPLTQEYWEELQHKQTARTSPRQKEKRKTNKEGKRNNKDKTKRCGESKLITRGVNCANKWKYKKRNSFMSGHTTHLSGKYSDSGMQGSNNTSVTPLEKESSHKSDLHS